MLIFSQQECIPVGCVPAARWPYRGGCKKKEMQKKAKKMQKNWGGGVCSRGGRVCSWGGCLLLGVGGYPSMHWGRTPPPPWTESQTPVKTLPWPNFVAAGKNLVSSFRQVIWKSTCQTAKSTCHGPADGCNGTIYPHNPAEIYCLWD